MATKKQVHTLLKAYVDARNMLNRSFQENAKHEGWKKQLSSFGIDTALHMAATMGELIKFGQEKATLSNTSSAKAVQDELPKDQDHKQLQDSNIHVAKALLWSSLVYFAVEQVSLNSKDKPVWEKTLKAQLKEAIEAVEKPVNEKLRYKDLK